MLLERALHEDEPMTAREASDEALMVRLMEGDAPAFDEIYQRFSGRIRTFIFRFIGDRESAEDLTQEVFLKVYRNPRAFDPRKRFLTWIFAVARNACIDFLRLKRLPLIPIGGTEDEDHRGPQLESPGATSPEDEALGRELEGKMQEVLATLSRKLREVFVLCAVQGLSYEEAAGVVGCPVKTISSRLSRARDRFFQGFSRYIDDGPAELRR